MLPSVALVTFLLELELVSPVLGRELAFTSTISALEISNNIVHN